MEELLKAITRAVEDKVFSPEILSNIAALRIRVTEQEKLIENLRIQNKNYQDATNALKVQIDAQSKIISEYKTREFELKTREINITKLEMTAEMYKALSAQSKEYVGMIFRNHNIMTSVQENQILSMSGGGTYTTSTKTETKF